MREERARLARRPGRWLMVGYGQEGPPPERLLTRLARGEVGGLIVFARNVPSWEAAREMARALSRLHPAPLVAVDEEGGWVSRLPPPWPSLPSAAAVAAASARPAQVRPYARALARALRSLGITVNLAPVLDLSLSPRHTVLGPRSLGDDAAHVAALGAAWVQGLQRGGVLAVAKHFPGHGSAWQDSHDDLPQAVLQPGELVPFSRAVRVGVMGMLAAHVAYPGWTEDPLTPATLSPGVLTRLLRQRLGFRGLCLTDCLEMGAITRHLQVGEAAWRSLAAGADLALVSHTPKRQEEAEEEVARALMDGRLPVARARAALRRAAVARCWLERQAPPPPSREAVEKLARAATALSSRAAYLAVTGEPLPPGNAGMAVMPAPQGPPGWERGPARAARVLQKALAAVGTDWREVWVGPQGGPVEPAWGEPPRACLVLVPALRRYPGWAQTWASLQSLAPWAMVLEDPYDAARLPGARAVAAALDPQAVVAALQALMGLGAPGRATVSLSAVDGQWTPASWQARETPTDGGKGGP